MKKTSDKHKLVHSVNDEAIVKRVGGGVAEFLFVRKTGGVNVVHGKLRW